jgi:hypothetical protein
MKIRYVDLLDTGCAYCAECSTRPTDYMLAVGGVEVPLCGVCCKEYLDSKGLEVTHERTES